MEVHFPGRDRCSSAAAPLLGGVPAPLHASGIGFLECVQLLLVNSRCLLLAILLGLLLLLRCGLLGPALLCPARHHARCGTDRRTFTTISPNRSAHRPSRRHPSSPR